MPTSEIYPERNCLEVNPGRNFTKISVGKTQEELQEKNSREILRVIPGKAQAKLLKTEFSNP